MKFRRLFHQLGLPRGRNGRLPMVDSAVDPGELAAGSDTPRHSEFILRIDSDRNFEHGSGSWERFLIPHQPM